MRLPPLGAAWWLLVACTFVSLAVAVGGSLRLGGYLLAATAGLGAALRLVLPESLAGALVVRSRSKDFLIYAVLAGCLFTVFAVLKLPA
ncbi:DUF3017 domain-containing protein [Yimella sp. cx-573]|nr:DUF3017 domain-containing protein [Yimella sp. cx-573]